MNMLIEISDVGECNSLVEVLHKHAQNQPDRLAYRFVRTDENQNRSISFSELDADARRVAAYLHANCDKNDRVLLFFAPGMDYIISFLGCLYAGVIAVPLYPPKRKEKLDRIVSVIKDCTPRFALMNKSTADHLQESFDQMLGSYVDFKLLTYEDSEQYAPAKRSGPFSQGDDIAFLQYTSGSTGEPKGVMVTHANLIANQKSISEGFKTHSDDVMISWLPLYHDMGLIGGILHPLYGGFSAHLMSPFSFMRDPLSWLEQISDVGATISGGPNFSYQLCVRDAKRSPERVKAIDLSKWRIAFNGAEPVLAHTLEIFSRAFKSTGFNPASFLPCYGLAEATLYVAGQSSVDKVKAFTVNRDELAKNQFTEDFTDRSMVTKLVSAGQASRNHHILIRNKDGEIADEGNIGEICVSGPSVAAGYWTNPKLSRKTFENYFNGKCYLATGDLGCIYKDELVVTGRQKDLIIINGRNYYPQDIELIVGFIHPALRPGCTAAFSISEGASNKIVVVQELDTKKLEGLDEDTIKQKIASQVLHGMEISLDDIVFVKPSTIPKTSSGKIRRSETSAQYVGNTLSIVDLGSTQKIARGRAKYFDAALIGQLPESAVYPVIEVGIGRVFAEKLHLRPDDLDMKASPMELGVGSLVLLNCQHLIERELNVSIDTKLLFGSPSLRFIADSVTKCYLNERNNLTEIAATSDNGEPTCELSPNQQTMWFLHQLDPDRVDYNIPVLLEIDRSITLEQMQNGVQRLCEQNAVLQTVYKSSSDGNVQIVVPELYPDVELLQGGEAELQKMFESRANSPFDLANLPPIRVCMANLPNGKTKALLVVHHIASDFWSMELLVKQLMQVIDGKPYDQSKSATYLDWCREKRKYLTSPKADSTKQYWAQKLTNYDSGSGLERRGAGEETDPLFRGLINNNLGADLSERIIDHAKSLGVTVNCLLMAAFQLTLHQLSEKPRLAIGTLSSGRENWRYREALGYFSNPLTIVSHWEEGDSCDSFIRECQNNVLEGLAHQEYPYSLVVKQTNSKNRVSENPLYEALFLMQQTSDSSGLESFAIKGERAEANIGGTKVRSIALNSKDTPYPFCLTAVKDNGVIKFNARYQEQYVTDESAQEIVERFVDQLTLFVSPDSNPSDTKLTPANTGVLQNTSAKSSVHCLNNSASLIEAFDQQAEKYPDRVSLDDGANKLTYRQLKERSDHLAAHLLLECSVTEGSRIGILLNRNVDLVVSILGVLKTGASYVPLDPHSPVKRLSHILKDADPALVITNSGFLESRADLIQQLEATIYIDQYNFSRSVNTPAIGDKAVTGQHVAYTIYTSGSTGRPKGVQVTHDNVLKLMQSSTEKFNFSCDDVWTLFHSYAFDFSVWEIWGALLFGGRLVIVPYEISRTPAKFYALVKSEGVTVLNQTPTAFRHFCQEDECSGGKIDSLRYVIFGGEALVFRNLKTWNSKYGDTQPVLVNMYGITETTVHTTFRAISSSDINTRKSLIGKPLNHLSIELLDEDQNPVAAGEIGEIYVGGDGVALGYWNNEALNQQRFVCLAVNGPDKSRYYRSGDLARLSSAGELEYLGRIDHQVNIKGFRIELGEIESAVKEFDGVDDCVVLAETKQHIPFLIQDAPIVSERFTDIRQLIRRPFDDDFRQFQDPKLVAYVVQSHEIDLGQITAHLVARIPEYMLPSRFIAIKRIPTNHSGKVNVEKLREKMACSESIKSAYSAPENEMEKFFATLFMECLGCDRVGRNDGFFALGGDSIQVLRVRSLAIDNGVDVSIRDIFRLQTPAKIAKVALGAVDVKEEERLPPFAQLSNAERALLPGDAVDAFPLSRLQDGLLFHSLFAADVAMYCDVFEFRVRTKYSESAFKSAVEALIDRHPILRTSFHYSGFDRPLQIVHDMAQAPISTFDYRGQPDANKESNYQSWLEIEKRTNYDVESAPLMRFSLHRFEDNEFVFTISFHDALLDGWSESSTVSEVLSNYFELMESGQIRRVDRVGTTYSDFVRIERETLEDEIVQKYWRDELDDFTPCYLPRWHAEKVDSHDAVMRFYAADLPPKLSDQLKAVARKLGVNVKTVLLAAHIRVISMLSGTADVTVGVESNGRLEDGDGTNVLGTHLNVVPWRLKMKPMTWAELIMEVANKEQELLPYRRYPYQELLRQTGRESLFDTSFNYTHFHVYEQLEKLNNLQLLDAKAYIQTHFALRVEFNQDPFTKNLNLDLEADQHAIGDQQVEVIADYFIRVLESIATETENVHTSVQLLPDKELVWQKSKLEGPRNSELLNEPYIERIDRIALTHSGAQACFDGKESRTYGDLKMKSKQLANEFRYRGIKKGQAVGILSDRNCDYLTIILSLWRLGAVVVPLPQSPAKRVSQIIARAQISTIICSQRYQSNVTNAALDAKIICISDLAPENYAPELCNEKIGPTDLAYTIFTSGSTGEPKGVMIEHGGMINHLQSKIDDLNMTHMDVISQDAAATFDICIWQLCAPLLVGGQVRIYPDGISKDPVLLIENVEKDAVTILEVSPSVLAVMVAERLNTEFISARSEEQSDFESLRWIVSSGEILQPALVGKLRAALPGISILNMWGATETSDDCTHFAIPYDWDYTRARIPIGSSIQNSNVLLLDSWMNPVPTGSSAELYVTGASLAKGYSNDEEKTNKAFVKVNGQMCYRTGDIGYLSQQGELFYIGRKDNQVKIRGHRIELGDVEKSLCRLDAVREAVVLAMPNSENELSLVSFIVPESSDRFEFGSVNGPWAMRVRKSLAKLLPDYMLPDMIVIEQTLPRNQNGKVDKKRLVVPEYTSEERVRAYIAPQGETQKVISDLFSQVLNVNAISVDESFFTLGGHSLLATQLASRIRHRLGIEMPIRTVFEFDTIRDLSEEIERTSNGRFKSSALIRTVPRDSQLSLSPNQERLWFIDKVDSTKASYNSYFAVRINGPLQKRVLKSVLQEIVDRHEILRTTFEEIDGSPVQVIHTKTELSFTSKKLGLSASGEELESIERLLEEIVVQPYTLSELPLCDAHLLELAEEDNILLWRNHHIVGDGWSAGVMLKEMETLYANRLEGGDECLPDLEIQCADYSAWQRDYLTSESCHQQLAFWLDYLDGYSGELDLTSDFMSEAVSEYSGKTIPVRIPSDLLSGVRSLCQSEKITLFHFLHSVVALVISRFTKESDIVIGSPVANRNSVELEQLVGFLTNTLPFRHSFDPHASVLGHMKSFGEKSVEVLDHQSLPFSFLVENFLSDRHSHRNPLVQVLLTLQNTDKNLPIIDGLSFERITLERGTSIMDLAFEFIETDEELNGSIEFSTSIFSQETVETLWSHAVQLIRKIVNNPLISIADISSLPRSKQIRLGQLWDEINSEEGGAEYYHPEAVENPEWDRFFELAASELSELDVYLDVRVH